MNFKQQLATLRSVLFRHYLGWYNTRVAKRLSHIAKYDFTSDWVTPNAPIWVDILKDYRDRPEVRMLEIGTCQGRSAIWFLENILTGSRAILTCIDHFMGLGDEPRFDHNLRLSGKAHQVLKLKGKSAKILPTLSKESFDIIYVDGDHSAMGVLLDGMLTWQRLKSGGILMFDDYLWAWYKPQLERPQIGIDLFLTIVEGRFELLHKDYQVILRKTKA